MASGRLRRGCERARPHSPDQHLQRARSSRRCRQGSAAARSGRRGSGARAGPASSINARDDSSGATPSSSAQAGRTGHARAPPACRSPAPARRWSNRHSRIRPQGSSTPSAATCGRKRTTGPVACPGTPADEDAQPADHALAPELGRSPTAVTLAPAGHAAPARPWYCLTPPALPVTSRGGWTTRKFAQWNQCPRLRRLDNLRR